MPRFTLILVLAALACALSAAPAFASSPLGTPSPGPVFAGYWSGFLEHWGNLLKKQNGIIVAVLGIGAVSLFIITRGKWKK